ncbi:MAG: PAS domain S-box protein [Treponema sp.]|jgi:PAS domain S-box-containing protein|nr:PAS domain S-box protein [Treponema sp.]
MRQFIKRALQKVDVLNPGQIHDLLVLSAKEIDRLETVMDSLIRGVLVCDIAHNLILANKAARRFLSIVAYEQARETIWSIIPEKAVADFLAQTLLSTDKVEGKEFDVDVNGVEKLLSVSVMPVVQDQKVTGSLILVDDITERRSREAMMRRMENLASLTTVAAGVAHEIKNPLGSLSIHVQLIQKAIAAQEKLCCEIHNELHQAEGTECSPHKYFSTIDKYLKIVNEEIDRLNSIVVDFLFAVRPMNVELRLGDINSLIKELAEFVSFELKNAQIECDLELAENLPMVNFDAGLMKQAFLNLLKNAAAAMQEGGKLSITTEEKEGEVQLVISDTGAGISEENFPKIFEPYFTTKENGTGLGLTAVFRIIKEHQGEIRVKSKEGEGSVFTIILPKPQIERRLLTYETVN